MLCKIYLELTIDPNDTDKTHVALISSISPIWISSLLKYETLSHQETMNTLG